MFHALPELGGRWAGCRGFYHLRLCAQVINHLLQDFDEMLSLRTFAAAPRVFSSTFVCELVFESGHGSAVCILVKFPYILMRENVPVVLGSERNAWAGRGMACTPFRNRVAEFPTVRGNLFLVPLALFVIPLMPAADPHPSVFFTFEQFKLVVRLRRIF
jgi:hypothetical protein